MPHPEVAAKANRTVRDAAEALAETKRVIHQGIDSGNFAPKTDPLETARVVLRSASNNDDLANETLDLAVATWFRSGGRKLSNDALGFQTIRTVLEIAELMLKSAVARLES